MRYRLRTLVMLTAVGPPALALAWFTLPLIFVQVIAIGLVVATVTFFVHWGMLVSDATEIKAVKLKNEINQQRSKVNRSRPT